MSKRINPYVARRVYEALEQGYARGLCVGRSKGMKRGKIEGTTYGFLLGVCASLMASAVGWFFVATAYFTGWPLWLTNLLSR